MELGWYQLAQDDGVVLDAAIELVEDGIVLRARGGAKANGLNPDDSKALELLLHRIRISNFSIDDILVDSKNTQGLSQAERSVYVAGDASLEVQSLTRQLGARMGMVGRQPGAKGPGNRTKRLRFLLSELPSSKQLASHLGLIEIEGDTRSLELIPDMDLNVVQPHHVYKAVQRILQGERNDIYGQKTKYVLQTPSGEHLPPKEVFGLALEIALGQSVSPREFKGGEGTMAFRKLREAGYVVSEYGHAAQVDQRHDQTHQDTEALAEVEDLVFHEGSERLRSHLVRERSRPLVRAKRSQMIEQLGHLECERCGVVPSKTLGDLGDAVIEVHHNARQVSEMTEGHETRLEDLQCLCANCHRIVHAELRNRN